MHHRLTTRWQHLDALARLRLGIIVALLVVGLLAALLGAFLGNDWPGIWLNLGTELIGAGLTFLLIDQLLRRRERQAAEEQAAATSKADLIARLGSNVRTFAVAAAEDLRRHGWLTDTSLHGVSLMTADLQGASLSHAQLHGANLGDANLAQADLGRAVLTEVKWTPCQAQSNHLFSFVSFLASVAKSLTHWGDGPTGCGTGCRALSTTSVLPVSTRHIAPIDAAGRLIPQRLV
jgi:hypothetical protein